MCVFVYIYIYIYRERERERDHVHPTIHPAINVSGQFSQIQLAEFRFEEDQQTVATATVTTCCLVEIDLVNVNQI